ncbi:sigma-70 family RNA polymerase sigma factor [Parabacteroides sp. FAFU027]|uniref:sigma-70 family RNA polymerase sigma factor n=1 Tax=Parabacteroides sp. FAFU027 TaxID=2922715 RepID=UPI001FAFAC71|nr:sigma-70 family RNA polymerase sigma factor [Parabacteroides sp. FAFU027]
MKATSPATNNLRKKDSIPGLDIFEKAYRDYFTRLELYAASILAEDEATDVVQDVFLYMWNNIEEFTKYSSVYAYLRRMVYCQCVDQIRHNRIAEKYISEQLYVSDSIRNDVDLTVSYRELERIYNNILEEMPPKRRDVYVLQQTTELSLADISLRMNISVKTVDCHLANARKTLRQKLISYQSR